jgi:hypothetical protein
MVVACAIDRRDRGGVSGLGLQNGPGNGPECSVNGA